jgi:hypothetical protein
MAAIAALKTHLDAKVEVVRAESGEFRAEVRARLDGIDRRLDDQGRVLAALIPTRLAAVPTERQAS